MLARSAPWGAFCLCGLKCKAAEAGATSRKLRCGFILVGFNGRDFSHRSDARPFGMVWPPRSARMSAPFGRTLIFGDCAGRCRGGKGVRWPLSDWLEVMQLIPAGPAFAIDRYFGHRAREAITTSQWSAIPHSRTRLAMRRAALGLADLATRAGFCPWCGLWWNCWPRCQSLR